MSSKNKSWLEIDNEETNNNNDYEEEKKNKPILEIYEYKLKTFCNSSPQLWFTNISKNKNCGIVKDDFDNIDEELLNYRSCDLMDSKINYQQNTSEKVFNKDKNITNSFTIDNITQKIFSKYPSRIRDSQLKKLFKNYFDIFNNETNNFYILRTVLENIHETMNNKNANHISNAPTYSNNIYYIDQKHLPPPDRRPVSPEDYRENLKNQYENIKSQHYSFHIQKLIIPDESVIFFCGDTHGSFHTTMRNILRLKYSGIIDNDFKIRKPNFYMIFLGDIVDYGYLGYENLMTILLLKLKNHDKVFIVQGNHEEYKQHWPEYWGNKYPSQGRFGKELKHKFKDNILLNKLTFHIEKLFVKLPSAICIKSVSDPQWIWCCHGGLPIIYREDKNQYWQIDVLDFLNNETTFFLPIPYEYANAIKWNDFQSKFENIPISRMAIGIESMIHYMNKNNIGFIMRGHQDNYKNTKLLSSPDFKIHKYTMIDMNESEQQWKDKCKKNKALTNIIDFGERKKIYKDQIAKDQIAESYLYRINTAGFDKTYKQECQLYPVLTLSTATGRSKLLERDSFTLLRYDINIDNYKINKDGYLLPTHEEPKKSITNNKNVNNNNKKSNNKKSNNNSNNNNNKNKSSNNYSSKRNVLPNTNNKNVNNNKLTINTSIIKEPPTPTNKISKIKLKSRFTIEDDDDDDENNNNNNNNNKKSMGGKTRKHQGIHQSGGKKGKLKKGYRYSGKKLKSGLSQIIKCKRKK